MCTYIYIYIYIYIYVIYRYVSVRHQETKITDASLLHVGQPLNRTKPAIKTGCKCYQEGNIPNTSLRNTAKDKNMLLPSSESVILKVISSRITAGHIPPSACYHHYQLKAER